MLHFIKRRTLLQRQGVAADVIGFQGQHMAQALFPILQSLTGQTVHHIDGQILKAAAADQLHRIGGLLIGMGATKLSKDLVVVRLDA